MALEKSLLKILACPVDKGRLIYSAERTMLYNPRLRRRYEIEKGVPVMLAHRARAVGDDEHSRLLELARTGGAVWTLS